MVKTQEHHSEYGLKAGIYACNRYAEMIYEAARDPSRNTLAESEINALNSAVMEVRGDDTIPQEMLSEEAIHLLENHDLYRQDEENLYPMRLRVVGGAPEPDDRTIEQKATDAHYALYTWRNTAVEHSARHISAIRRELQELKERNAAKYYCNCYAEKIYEAAEGGERIKLTASEIRGLAHEILEMARRDEIPETSLSENAINLLQNYDVHEAKLAEFAESGGEEYIPTECALDEMALKLENDHYERSQLASVYSEQHITAIRKELGVVTVDPPG